MRTGLLIGIRDYVESRGISFLPLLNAAGIDPKVLGDPFEIVPYNSVFDVFERAARALQDPCFGVNAAQQFKMGSSGLLGQLTLKAPTVRDAAKYSAGYIHLWASGAEAGYSEQAGIGEFWWATPAAISAPRTQVNLFIATSVLRRIRLGAGPEWMPLAVEFEHRMPQGAPCAMQLFGERVRYNGERNLFVIDANALAKPMPGADPVMFGMLIDLADRWTRDMGSEFDDASAARSAILQALKTNKADLESIAGSLGITARSLQWRLEQAGTSFEKVLNETRADLAGHLLRDTDRPLTEIAFDLGFSDPSTLTRAARRWFGMSPRAFRLKHREANSNEPPHPGTPSLKSGRR